MTHEFSIADYDAGHCRYAAMSATAKAQYAARQDAETALRLDISMSELQNRKASGIAMLQQILES